MPSSNALLENAERCIQQDYLAWPNTWRGRGACGLGAARGEAKVKDIREFTKEGDAKVSGGTDETGTR